MDEADVLSDHVKEKPKRVLMLGQDTLVFAELLLHEELHDSGSDIFGCVGLLGQGFLQLRQSPAQGRDVSLHVVSMLGPVLGQTGVRPLLSQILLGPLDLDNDKL